MCKELEVYGFAGPAGSGKGTMIDMVRNARPDLGFCISYTTRPLGANEVDGVHYHSISESCFLAKVASDLFIEYANNHGWYYGRLRSDFPQCGGVILDLDIAGAETYRLLFGSRFRMIYLDGDEEMLRTRLVERKRDTLDQIERRIRRIGPDRERALGLLTADDRYIMNTNKEETFGIILEMMNASVRGLQIACG